MGEGAGATELADRAIRAVAHGRTQRGPSTALGAALAAFAGARDVPDRFIGTFYDETATSEQLLEVLAHLETGTSELMCHSGYADGILIAGLVHNRQRERELVFLTSEEVRGG